MGGGSREADMRFSEPKVRVRGGDPASEKKTKRKNSEV